MSSQTSEIKPNVVFPVYVVGKPAYDYSPFNIVYSGKLLEWNFAEQSREQIINTLGPVNKFISGLEKWVEAAKDILKEEAKKLNIKVGEQSEIKAGDWVGVVSHRERIGLDTEAIKAEMGDAWVAAHSKVTDYYEIRFKTAA